MSRDWIVGVVGLCTLGELLLLYALIGNPPYPIYSALKVTVVPATGTGAWALFEQSKRYLPISIGLLLIGGIHLFDKMRRRDWATFNWAGCGPNDCSDDLDDQSASIPTIGLSEFQLVGPFTQIGNTLAGPRRLLRNSSTGRSKGCA